MKPLLNKASGQPWAISQHGLTRIMGLSLPETTQQQVCSQGAMLADDLRDMLSIYFNQRQSMSIEDGIAYIHAYGPMMDDASPLELAMGSTGYEEISADIAQANASEDVKAIIMVANTPGGTVSGIKETVQTMDNSEKPIYGYNAGSATSAGYYLLAGTETIGASPSSITGNVGTVLAWYDDSKFLESMGFEYQVMTNEGADLKGTFRDSPMTDSQRQFLQDGLNSTGDEFFDHVKSNRPDAPDEVKRAGWYNPSESGDMGLIDMEGSLAEFASWVKTQVDIGESLHA